MNTQAELPDKTRIRLSDKEWSLIKHLRSLGLEYEAVIIGHGGEPTLLSEAYKKVKL